MIRENCQRVFCREPVLCVGAVRGASAQSDERTIKHVSLNQFAWILNAPVDAHASPSVLANKLQVVTVPADDLVIAVNY